MATGKDVREMLGLPMGDSAPKPAIAKKAKVPGAQHRLKGINREILALHGDRAPPVSIIDSGKVYRAKLQRDFKPAHWANASFTNQARTDGLQLRHWRRQQPPKVKGATEGEDSENQDPEELPEEQYSFAKYNVQITVPTYTDEHYEAHLKSDSWTREETDYLMELVKDYAQKWPVIIDRYEWTQDSTKAEEEPPTAVAKASDNVPRTLEQLKDRYYKVWAKSLEISAGGEKNMSESEFALHETLTKYNPYQEETRKNLAWKLAERSADDVREEEFLLNELQRIMISSQKLEAERQEVRDRLEPAQPVAGGNNMYASASSAALQQLYSQLAAQDRNRKARHRLSLNVNDLGSSPAGLGGLANGTPLTASGRDSMGASGQKKGSAAGPAQTPVRQISPRQEARYGVSTHDRLTSGVTFRSDKLLKMRQAKSQIQTQKIANALVELQVPEIIVLPTERVCNGFEKLVQTVTKLVDSRKVLEKEENELKVGLNVRQEKAKQEGKAVPELGEDGDISMQDVDATEITEKADDEDDADDAEEVEADADEVEADADGDEEDDDEDADDADADAEVEEEDEADDDDDDPEDKADEDGEEDADGEVEDEEEDEPEAEPEPEIEPVRPTSSRSAVSMTKSNHKRSVSVLSAASSKASKRGRR